MLAHAGSADESLSALLLFAGLWMGWAASSRIRGKGFPRLPEWAAWAGVTLAIVLAIGALVVPRRLLPGPVVGAVASGPRPSSTAQLAFTSPSPGTHETGAELEVVLDLSGAEVVDGASTRIAPDTGHVHLSLDGKLISMTYGLVQLVDLRSLDPGSHELTAEFVAADHAPFDPRVTTSVRFEKDAP